MRIVYIQFYEHYSTYEPWEKISDILDDDEVKIIPAVGMLIGSTKHHLILGLSRHFEDEDDEESAFTIARIARGAIVEHVEVDLDKFVKWVRSVGTVKKRQKGID